MQRTKVTLPPHTLSVVRYEMWKREIDKKSEYVNEVLEEIADGKHNDIEVGPKRESQAIYVDKELVDKAKPIAEEKGFANLSHMVINVIDNKKVDVQPKIESNEVTTTPNVNDDSFESVFAMFSESVVKMIETSFEDSSFVKGMLSEVFENLSEEDREKAIGIWEEKIQKLNKQ